MSSEEADVGGSDGDRRLPRRCLPTTATLGSNTVVWTSTGAALQTWLVKRGGIDGE
ncbi:hypothetical protein O9993_15225 [Vibrio lentus]|nr:hypothetical protein [Vibrio lentus]